MVHTDEPKQYTPPPKAKLYHMKLATMPLVDTWLLLLHICDTISPKTTGAWWGKRN